MIKVYAWPPVGAVGREWTQIQPVERLRSAITGRDQMQASERNRRIATLQVSALANGRSGAGYCEMLKQLLSGGIHAVRLRSSPINWWRDDCRRRDARLNSYPVTWTTGDAPMIWTVGGAGLVWYDRTAVIAGTAAEDGDFYALPVTGLPASMIVGRPGDFIRIFDVSDPGVSEVARLVRVAMTDASGAVTLRLDRMPTISGGRVNMAGQDEAVFRVDGDLPRAVQPLDSDWRYDWSFREVFADEVGGFTEVDPWT